MFHASAVLLYISAVCVHVDTRRLGLQQEGSAALNSVSSFLQSHGYAKVDRLTKSETAGEATPGLQVEYNDILQRAADDIRNSAQQIIRDGHQSTQDATDQTVNNLDETTEEAVNKKGAADDLDKQWMDCVAEERDLRVEVESAEDRLATSRNNVKAPCDEQQNLRSFETQVPVRPFACDFFVSGNCDEQLENLRTWSQDMVATTRSDVDAAGGTYQEAASACEAAKADVVQKEGERDDAVAAWQTKKGDCSEKYEARVDAMCLFGKAYQDKCQALASYSSHLAEVDAEDGAEHSHPDRMREWQATEVVACLLDTVREGGEMDEDSLAACEAAVNYDRDVGQLNRRAPDVIRLTEPDKFTCSEDTIDFAGETWDLPVGEVPASSDYEI